MQSFRAAQNVQLWLSAPEKTGRGRVPRLGSKFGLTMTPCRYIRNRHFVLDPSRLRMSRLRASSPKKTGIEEAFTGALINGGKRG